MSTAAIIVLLVIAVLGHAMALFWYLAVTRQWAISRRVIYDLPIARDQIRRELRNSIHAPLHAVILAGFLLLGCFRNTSVGSFFATALLTTIWAEVWHYASHRAFHLKRLHWIHVEHHRSHLNSWLTAISFSFTEKLVFDLGLLGVLAIVDLFVSLKFLRHRRLVHRLSDCQFVQPRQLRVSPQGLQSRDGKGDDHHHLPFAPSLALHRQLRARHQGA